MYAEDLMLRSRAEVAALTRQVPQAEDGSDEYGGSKPFSEPESRIVRLLAENTRPQVTPSLHMHCQRGQCVIAVVAD